eukprot:4954866-Pleurochrysis_carterae.AAC.2
MNITDEMAATDTKKVKAMWTSIGWFSSSLCALIYQCSRYVALHSSKGYAIRAKCFGCGSTRSSTARRKSPSTTSCSARVRRGDAGHLRLSRLHLLHRRSRHRALLDARQLAHLPG